MKRLISAIYLFLFCGFALQAQESEDFNQLISWMTGEFDSSDQASEDSAYYNISLKMTRIWPNAPTGAWIYVEQAMASTPDEPYRQRVYFVSELSDGEYTSDIYTIPNEEAFIGAWKDPSKFDGMKPFDLKYKDGCTVFLNYDGFQYSGKTNDGTCSSNLRGATYATSEVLILDGELRSWDRGYSEDKKQVWGAEKGGYIFKK